MGAILTVMTKVAVMLILIIAGFLVTRAGWLTEKGAAEITTLLVKLVTPCLIVNSLLGAGSLAVGEMLLAAAVSALAIVLAILISLCFFRKEPLPRRKVLRFAAIFSNAGFMGLPLVEGIVGERGVVFGSFFIAVFNLICWTYGYAMMSGGKINIKTALLNPGIIGLAVGLPVYFLKLRLPAVITEPVAFLSDLNTPLAMLVIGSFVAKVDARSFLSDLSVYKMSFLRLIVCPGVYLLVLFFLRPQADLLVSSVIQASAPVAANTALFAVEYGGDSELASKSVAVSTVLSILTIPLMTLLAQLLV